MLSKSKIKLITSLTHKKYRDETGLFVAEGVKLISDLATTFHCELLLYTPQREIEVRHLQADERISVEEKELHKISAQKSPQGMLAVFRKKTPVKITATALSGQLCLALDEVQDPGNLGTIIRIADWFGIDQILCSPETADIYNPKTVQASMGAIARVRTFYGQLPSLLSGQGDLPLYGTFLEGASIYSEPLTTEGVIVLGSEGKGISEATERLINRRLFIPGHPAGEVASESLNVAAAAAVVCAFFRRTKA